MVDPIFDYDKLRGRIKEVCGTESKYAEKIGLGRVSVSQRLNNQAEFTQQEMLETANILEFPIEDIPTYFFKEKVQKREPR